MISSKSCSACPSLTFDFHLQIITEAELLTSETSGITLEKNTIYDTFIKKN